MKSTIASIILAVMCAACGSASPKQHKQKQPPPSNLPVSMETARQTALAQVQGQVEEEELDEEKGRWVYEFDIQPAAGAAKKEVQVDATTGAVVKVEDDD